MHVRKAVILQRTAAFFSFLLIPFLGGNHLALYFFCIDRFWIETSFLLSLIVALFASFMTGKKPSRHVGTFCLVALPLAAVSAASLTYTWNRFATLNEINVLVWSFGAVFLYLLADDRDELHQALIVGSLLLVLSAVIQFKVLLPGLAHAFSGGRYGLIVREQIAPFGAFLNQNMLGGYFLYTLPLVLYVAIVKKNNPYTLAASALILGILLSVSRLAMIIGFGGGATACALLTRSTKSKCLLRLACCFGGALLIFGLLLQGENREKNSSMKTLVGAKVETASTGITTLDKRTGVWANGFQAFLSKPLVGYGAGTFEYAYRKYYDGVLYTKFAHSSLVKTAVELGAVGVLAFFLYLAAFGRGILKGVREPGLEFLAVSALSGLLFGLIDFAFDMPAHLVTFFIVSCIFLRPGPATAPMAAGRPVLFAMIAVLLFSFLFTTKAGFSRKLVEDGVLCEEAGLFTEAYVSYRDAVEAMPLNNDGYVRIISILLRSHDNERNRENKEKLKLALKSYLSETERCSDQDAELYFMQSRAHSTLDPGKDACDLGSKAIILYPSSAHYIYETARCYARLGDFDKALSIISRVQPYLPGFEVSGNPQGMFIYKVRDLEADIEYRKGNPDKALAIERKNLLEGVAGKYSISHAKARESLSKDVLIGYLMEKVTFYEHAVRNGRVKPTAASGI